MNNEAIERDEALEEISKQERPYDPDKLCQFNITCREGLKRAVMAAGAARQMSAGKYAAILLANALGDPALNAPPEKSTSDQVRTDGRTKNEKALNARIVELNAALEKQKEKLFIACALLDQMNDTVGRDYYVALIRILGMGEEFNKWKENLK